MSLAVQYFSLLPFLLALSALVYVILRKLAPTAARISLAMGGALAGGFLAPAVFVFLIEPFRDGWKNFGLFFWGVPIFLVGGVIGGFLAALRWTAQTTAGRRKLNIALYSTALLAPAVLFLLPNALAFLLHDPRGDTMQQRSVTIDGFTASPQSLAFVIPTRESDHVRAIVFVDRATRQASFIGEIGFSYIEPRLSWDGERLLFVRRKRETKQHELFSCFVKTWQCRLVLRTENDVVSPVEIDRDVIIYSSSPLVTLPDRQRYSRHDFYLIKVGSDPIQLSDFGEVALHNINVNGDKVIFGSFAPSTSTVKSILAGESIFSDPRSGIFELTFDREAARIPTPSEKLKPKFLIGGYSANPSVSQDGRKVAFLNTETGKGSYRFNLMVFDVGSGLQKSIKLEGSNFSPAAFAGNQMLFNELMSKRYRVRAWNPTSDATEDVFEIEFSKLESLPHIELCKDMSALGH
jgi:WD40-like Beta Propeller Repeat